MIFGTIIRLKNNDLPILTIDRTMTPSSSPTSQDIKNLFDQIAPIYDSLNDGLSFGVHRVWKSMAVKWSEH